MSYTHHSRTRVAWALGQASRSMAKFGTRELIYVENTTLTQIT